MTLTFYLLILKKQSNYQYSNILHINLLYYIPLIPKRSCLEICKTSIFETTLDADYVLVIPRFGVQYHQYFPSFSHLADLLHESLGE